MPLKIMWYNAEKTIITYEASGRWTWEEFYKENEEGKRLIRSVSHMVYVIARATDSVAQNYLPANSLTHLPNLTKSMPENVGLAVAVTNKPVWITLDRLISKISPSYSKRIRFALSEEQALIYFREYATKHDPTQQLLI